MTMYPVMLQVAGRRCLVVGGGRVALRKVEGLLGAGADVTVIAPEVDARIDALDVAVERRPYRRGDVAGFRLVITATDDAAVNAARVRRRRGRRRVGELGRRHRALLVHAPR